MVGMFTCARIKATKGKGADFYRQHLSCNDYYSEHEVVKGVWHGTLADDFHLSGKDVSQSVFSAFQQNIDPVSGRHIRKMRKTELSPDIPLRRSCVTARHIGRTGNLDSKGRLVLSTVII